MILYESDNESMQGVGEGRKGQRGREEYSHNVHYKLQIKIRYQISNATYFSQFSWLWMWPLVMLKMKMLNVANDPLCDTMIMAGCLVWLISQNKETLNVKSVTTSQGNNFYLLSAF